MTSDDQNQDTQISELTILRKQAAAIAVKLKVLWRSSTYQEDDEDIDIMINEPIGNSGDSLMIEHLFEEASILYRGLKALEEKASLIHQLNIVIASNSSK